MKRYRQYTEVYCDCTIQENPDGEWVKWEDFYRYETALKKLVAVYSAGTVSTVTIDDALYYALQLLREGK